MAIYTSTTVHNVRDIRAHSTYSLGSPLVISMVDNYGHSCSVTIFTGNEALTQRLVDAINQAVVPLETDNSMMELH